MATGPGSRLYVALAAWVLVGAARADGLVVDKVYHPYVDQLAWELEWRLVQANEDPATGRERRQLQRLGMGRAVGERLFAEVYLIGGQNADESLEVEGYEAEALWQLSEQGEFLLDYGLLFEVEKERDLDRWEYATTLLLEREFGSLSATANAGVVYEWGSDVSDEIETTLSLQGRYRYSPQFEPALELYMGEETRGLGPVVLGRKRFGQMRALRWELGLILGLESSTADYTLRAMLEYEF
jgi:hypothetical protein